MSQNKNPLAAERIGKLLAGYAVPSIISMLIGSLYNIVDQIFVGHGVGYLGNCATSILFPLTVVGLAIALLIGDGAAAYLSLCQGRNSTSGFDRRLGSGLIIGIALSIVYMVIFFLFTDQILIAFGATDATLSYAKEYGIVIFCGMPFYVVSNLLSSVIRADGSPRFALLSMLSGAVLNIVFDPVFIFVFDMGVLGAAVATIAGQIVSCVTALAYLRKTKTFILCKGSFRFQPSSMLVMLPLGISSFLTQVTIVLTSAVSNSQMSGYGAQSVYGSDIPVAVNGIVMKVFAICVSVAIGLVVGAQPIIGFNYGAGNYKRVRKTFDLVTVITIIVCAAATFMFECFPAAIIKLFGDDDPVYIEFAVLCFRIYLSLIVLTCFQKISGVFLQAMGRPVQSIIVSICRDLLFLLPLMLILPKAFGIMGLLYSGPAADILAFIVTIVFISIQMNKLKHYNEGKKVNNE